MIKFLFWISIAIILYANLFYPLLIMLISKFISRPVKKGRYEPYVTLIIPAFNEGKIIQDKIENSLRLEYPQHKLRIVVASDGSTDDTSMIVKRYHGKGILFIDNAHHLGKAQLINQVMAQIHSEIVIFSDASGMLSKEAVKEMVNNFYDPHVGCVCGIYRIAEKRRGQADAFEQSYLDFETILKKRESMIYTTLGGHGALYAIRKHLFSPLKEETINEDFIISSKILLKGYRTVYEEKALVYDKVDTSLENEFRRRVRISAGNWQQVFILKELLAARRYSVAWQFVSHKILRILTPFLLILVFSSSFFLGGRLRRMVLPGICFFLVLALFGWIFREKKEYSGILSAPFFICLENAAYIVGAYKFLFSKKIEW